MRTNPPARGEEVALQGYTAQYLVAAELILSALRNSEFESAILKDFRAERVDDIQIVSKSRIDAYQVKWHVPPTPLTPSKLSGPKRNPEKGLLRQLADGWKALSDSNGDKDVFVHLYTTSAPSITGISDIPRSETPPRHLAEFLRTYWERETTDQGAATKWHPYIRKLQSASGLSASQFEEFRLHCSFNLNRRSPQEREEYSFSARHYKDMEHLQAKLLKKAGEQQGTIRLSRNDILELAGWTSRFEFKARHEFPVTKHYVPIENSVGRLEAVVQMYDHGYIALLGSPGSGKSTLLTKTLLYRPKVRVLRYYCFVPNDTALSRGEAFNFLHDLVLTLWNEGVRPTSHSMGETIEQLRKTFLAQLNEIGHLWKEQGVRTVVLVDGLDHIRREGNPERSLLNEFPLPSAIPQGCLFVLGSQTLDRIDLHIRIIQHLEEGNSARTITMERLSRRDVRKIVQNRLPNNSVSLEDLERIEILSAGHPLALNYILNRLENSGMSELSAVLSEIPTYADSIEKEYEIYWRQLDDDAELRELLALLSRMRGTLNMELTASLANDATVRKLFFGANHYFLEMPDLQWKFFHNSFRQFLLDKTGRNAFAIADNNAHRSYHDRLADLAASEAAPTVFRWEQVYHTYHAGRIDEILRIATQAYFRDQCLASRPASLILDDAVLVMRAAKDRGDIITTIRVLLIELEVNSRAGILDQTNIPGLLLGIDKREKAVKHILHDDQLLIDPAQALDFACNLADAGYGELGREIFEVAEPLDKLSGIDSGGIVRHGRHVLDAWVECAVRFRSLEEVREVITRQFATESDFLSGSVSGTTRRLRERLFLQFADAVIDKGVRSEIEELPSLLQDFFDEGVISERTAYILACSEVDPVWREEMFNFLLRRKDEKPLPEYILRGVAGLLLKQERDSATAMELFKNLTPPKPLSEMQGGGRGIKPYAGVLRYYRLSAALGYSKDPAVVVPDATQDHERGKVLIERMVVRMANIWGAGWRGEVIPPVSVVREISPAIRLTERRDDHDLRLAFAGVVTEYLAMAINAAAAHGEQALLALEEFFEQRWSDDRGGVDWPNPIQRSVSLELFRAGSPKWKLVARLEALEPEANLEQDVAEFHENCKEQAEAWIEADEPHRAENCIHLILNSSFGVYHEKDSQIDEWAKWFATVMKNSPEVAIRDFCVVADGIVTAGGYSRGAGSSDAVITLLAAIAGYDADTAHTLKHFLWDEKVVGFLSALEAFLLAGFRDNSVNIEVPVGLFCRIYVPYVRRVEEKVIKAFIVRISRLTMERQSEEYLERLMETIEREVAPKLCGQWWIILEENIRQFPGLTRLRARVVERVARQRPETHHTKGRVTLQDGTVIEEDDLLEQGKSAEKLIQIVENIKEDSFYTWWRLIESILPDLLKEQVETLCQAMAELGKDGRDICGLIGRLYELGDADGAESLALKALQGSKSEGWSHYYDGGSRIEPYKVLVKIDKKYAKQAFEQFTEDYLQGYRPYYLTSILEEFVSVFWVTPPYDALWAEVFGHFSQLREFACPAITLPRTVTLREDRASRLPDILVESAFDAFIMPQPEVRDDAYKSIVEFYRNVAQTRLQIASRLMEFLDGPGEMPMLGMAVIRGLVGAVPSLVDEFRERLARLLGNDDIAIRLAAQGILAVAEPSPLIRRDRPLSPVYTMALPDFETMEQRVSSEMVEPGSVLLDTHDPLQKIGVAQEALELIHQRTGLSFRNLVERTVSLMRMAIPEQEWNSDAERALLSRSKALGLETAYRRPRALAAFLALGRVIAELYDAEKLSDSDLDVFRACLSQIDVYLVDTAPQGRNLSPIAITVPDGYAGSVQEWLESPMPEVHAPPQADQDSMVLGIVTEAQVPRWEAPSEFICGGICPPNLAETEIHDSPESIIPGTMLSFWWMAEQYPHLPFLKSALERSLLVRAHSQRVEMGRASWLALNPSVALDLGWSHSDSGLFRWVNDDGHIMVESEWWRTGRLNRHPPDDGIRAEGWIVKASRSGFEELRQRCFPATWAQGVRKTREEQKEHKERCWISINSI